MNIEQISELCKYICSVETVLLILILIVAADKVKVAINWLDEKFLNKDAVTKKIKKFYKDNCKIKSMLEVSRSKFKAARATFIVFHNGGKDIGGVQFLKFSALEEVVSKGVIPSLDQKQAISLHVIVDWLDKLVSDQAIIEETDDKGILHSTKSFLDMFDVLKVVAVPIWKGPALVGMIALEWLNEQYAPKDLEAIVPELRDLAKFIEIERYTR